MSLDIRSHQTAVECIHFTFYFIPPRLFQWSNLLPTSHLFYFFFLLSLIFGSISQSVPIFDVVEWTQTTAKKKPIITQSIIKTSSSDSVAVFYFSCCSYFDLFFFWLDRWMDGSMLKCIKHFFFFHKKETLHILHTQS